MNNFKTEIHIIGINPYGLVPEDVLDEIFYKAGNDKVPISVKGTINDKYFIQRLV
jgi:hypothetical protein